MHLSSPRHSETVWHDVNHVGLPHDKATFSLADVRALVHDDPALIYVASGWAKRFHPCTTLARAV